MASFLLGIVASLAATTIWYLMIAIAERRRMGHLSGYWFQIIPGFTGRCYSIGRFFYSRYSRSLQWDGTNYTLDGTPHCEWESIHLHMDPSTRKLLYIYRGRRQSAGFSEFYGFGVMNLQEATNGKLLPHGGHFQDAQEAATPQSFSLSKIEDIAAKLDIQQGSLCTRDFHHRIVLEYHAAYAGRLSALGESPQTVTPRRNDIGSGT